MGYPSCLSTDAPLNLGEMFCQNHWRDLMVSNCQESIAALLVEAGCHLVIATRGASDQHSSAVFQANFI